MICAPWITAILGFLALEVGALGPVYAASAPVVLEVERPSSAAKRIEVFTYSLNRSDSGGLDPKKSEALPSVANAKLRIASHDSHWKVAYRGKFLNPIESELGLYFYEVEVPAGEASRAIGIYGFNPLTQQERTEWIRIVPSTERVKGLRGILEQNRAFESLRGLEIDSKLEKGESFIVEGRRKYRFKIRGKLASSDARVLINYEASRRIASGGFEVDLVIDRNPALLDVQLINPRGAVESTQYVARVDFGIRPEGPSHFLNASLGATLTDYSETLSPDLSQVGITLKAGYDRVFQGTPWFLGVNSYVTALSFPSAPYTQGIRYLGANAKLGYVFPFMADPWRLAVSMGAYYTTTFTDGSVGFRNMFGPQVFPSLGYRLTGRDSLGTYLKYSPILSGGDLTFASREFATGLAWTRSLPNSRAFSVSFDFGLLDLVIKKVLKIRSQTMSLSAGYSF